MATVFVDLRQEEAGSADWIERVCIFPENSLGEKMQVLLWIWGSKVPSSCIST